MAVSVILEIYICQRGTYLCRFVHRADYIDVLLEEADRLGIQIRLGCEVKEMNIGAPWVTLSNDEIVTADVIIGCDGMSPLTPPQAVIQLSIRYQLDRPQSSIPYHSTPANQYIGVPCATHSFSTLIIHLHIHHHVLEMPLLARSSCAYSPLPHPRRRDIQPRGYYCRPWA